MLGGGGTCGTKLQHNIRAVALHETQVCTNGTCSRLAAVHIPYLPTTPGAVQGLLTTLLTSCHYALLMRVWHHRVTTAPWRAAGADISDYFNYGLTERTWRQYQVGVT